MRHSKTPLLEHHSFSRGPANIVISDRDIVALKALAHMGGRVAAPADLGGALDQSLDGTRKSLLGGRHLRRLESVGFVRVLAAPGVGFEITVTGLAAAATDD